MGRASTPPAEPCSRSMPLSRRGGSTGGCTAGGGGEAELIWGLVCGRWV